MTVSQDIENWVDSAEHSLSASLLLGRTSARSIAKAHLLELFKLVDSDFDAALTQVLKIESFSSRRLLMECFRLTFSLKQVKPEYAILLEDTDLTDKRSAHQYDMALMALLRECGGSRENLLTKVLSYPIVKRRMISKRLDDPSFKKARRIRVNRNYIGNFLDSETSWSPLTWWQWTILIFLVTLILQLFV